MKLRILVIVGLLPITLPAASSTQLMQEKEGDSSFSLSIKRVGAHVLSIKNEVVISKEDTKELFSHIISFRFSDSGIKNIQISISINKKVELEFWLYYASLLKKHVLMNMKTRGSIYLEDIVNNIDPLIQLVQQGALLDGLAQPIKITNDVDMARTFFMLYAERLILQIVKSFLELKKYTVPVTLNLQLLQYTKQLENIGLPTIFYTDVPGVIVSFLTGSKSLNDVEKTFKEYEDIYSKKELKNLDSSEEEELKKLQLKEDFLNEKKKNYWPIDDADRLTTSEMNRKIFLENKNRFEKQIAQQEKMRTEHEEIRKAVEQIVPEVPKQDTPIPKKPSLFSNKYKWALGGGLTAAALIALYWLSQNQERFKNLAPFLSRMWLKGVR